MRAFTTKRTFSLAVVLAAATFLLGACGDDDDSEGLAIDSGTPQDQGDNANSSDDGTNGDCVPVEDIDGSCKGHRHRGSTTGLRFQGCMVFPAGPGGGVEIGSGGGPGGGLAPYL